MKGMDTTEVRRSASQIERAGRDVGDVVIAINSLLAQHHSDWRGQDFERFQSAWKDSLRRATQEAAGQLTAFGRRALENADRQDRTSSKY